MTIDLSFVHAATAHGSRAALVEDHPLVRIGVVMKPGALVEAGQSVGLKWKAVGSAELNMSGPSDKYAITICRCLAVRAWVGALGASITAGPAQLQGRTRRS
ncbi:MAG: hypothetical protein CM15mP120_28650 [Pseudomonadota bacterium]|nr:MAG: hypothetical protein CM15mP120_28650 [Pseudomonadota bacterium]